jgi:hypothetical protein
MAKARSEGNQFIALQHTALVYDLGLTSATLAKVSMQAVFPSPK